MNFKRSHKILMDSEDRHALRRYRIILKIAQNTFLYRNFSNNIDKHQK